MRETRPRRRSERARWCVAAGCSVALAAGCEGPLGPKDSDLGLRLDPEKLSSATPLNLHDLARPAPAENDSMNRSKPADPFAGAPTAPVSIEQCRAWTLQHNLNLNVAMYEPRKAREDLTAEEAKFEAAFFMRVEGSGADGPRSLVFPDRTVEPFNFDPGVRVPLRTGGETVVRFPLVKNEEFDGQQTYGGDWSQDVELAFVQPLLRDAGREAATYSIRIASLESQAVEARTKVEVIRQLAAADRAYWLLYASERVLDVLSQQFDIATRQVREAEARFKNKVGPEIEIVRAEAGLARRIDAILAAQNEYRERQRLLKQVINMPGADVDSKVVLTIESAPTLVPYAIADDAMVGLALVNRAELLEIELRIAQTLSTIDFSRNQALPLCTLDYTFRVNGMGDNPANASNSIGNFDSSGWILGLNVEVPLGNAAAEARVHRAILDRLQRLATRSDREQSIKKEVLSALDNLRTSWEQIQAARQTTRAEERNFVGEQQQFRLGVRTSTDVLDAATRVAEAKIDVYRSIAAYQIAQVDLAFATGTLLGADRVSWGERVNQPANDVAPDSPEGGDAAAAHAQPVVPAEPATGEEHD